MNENTRGLSRWVLQYSGKSMAPAWHGNKGAWPHAVRIPVWNWHCCPLYRAGNQAGAVLFKVCGTGKDIRGRASL